MGDNQEQSPAQQIVEAWRAHDRMNRLLIDAVSIEGWQATLSKRGGRGVVGELAHMHTNRVWQLEKRSKKLATGLNKYTAKETPAPRTLKNDFKKSGAAVEKLLLGQLAGEDGYRGFNRGVFTTLSYFVSHESHHRGRILLTLKVSGHTLDKDAAYRLWDWDRV